LKRIVAILMMFLAAAPVAAAQQVRRKPPVPPQEQTASEQPAELAEAAAQSRAHLIAATRSYQTSLEKLLALFRAEEERAEALVEKRRTLFAEGVLARRELEESEQSLAATRGKIADTRKQMDEAEQLITEVIAAEQLAKLPVEPPGAYRVTLTLIRYTGPASWALNDITKLDAFFQGAFGRPLPVSAFGQTATHNQLGFDHREGLDVALHPDSVEGRALIAYLRAQGISFIAFRGAVTGSATGAHIHIGRPSPRLTGSL
jgi:hypothetical protein